MSVEDIERGEVDLAQVPRESKRPPAAPGRDNGNPVECLLRQRAGAEDGDVVPAAHERVGQAMDLVAHADLAARRQVEADQSNSHGRATPSQESERWTRQPASPAPGTGRIGRRTGDRANARFAASAGQVIPGPGRISAAVTTPAEPVGIRRCRRRHQLRPAVLLTFEDFGHPVRVAFGNSKAEAIPWRACGRDPFIGEDHRHAAGASVSYMRIDEVPYPRGRG